VSFIDDHTRKVWVYFMKHKVKCFNIFWISKQWWRRRKVWTSNA
jgi:hypothetical protein